MVQARVAKALAGHERQLLVRFHELKGKKEALEAELAELDTRVIENQRRSGTLDESIVILNLAAERSRKKIQETVEGITTKTIRSIMESDRYDFQIVFEKKRGQIEARPVVDPPGGNLLDTKGGTVLDIITTTLRLIIKQLLNAGGPIIMDEPAKHVAEAHRTNFIRVLKEFSRKTVTQIIMCAHPREYIQEADKAIEVKYIEDRSTARVV